MFNVSDWFMFALAAGFSLITIFHAYQQGDANKVLSAERRRDRAAKKKERLSACLAGLCAEHAKQYTKLRDIGLETIAQAKELIEIFIRSTQNHARFPFNPEIPNFNLPAELDNPDPPPPPLPVRPTRSPNFQ
jgi:hypothetical protein